MSAATLDPWMAARMGLAAPLTREAIDDWRLARLNETIVYARAASPFYCARRDWTDGPLAKIEDLARLPFTTAADLLPSIRRCWRCRNRHRARRHARNLGHERFAKAALFHPRRFGSDGRFLPSRYGSVRATGRPGGDRLSWPPAWRGRRGACGRAAPTWRRACCRAAAARSSRARRLAARRAA